MYLYTATLSLIYRYKYNSDNTLLNNTISKGNSGQSYLQCNKTDGKYMSMAIEDICKRDAIFAQCFLPD